MASFLETGLLMAWPPANSRVIPQDVPITISAGLAGFSGDANTQETLVKKADDALYQAKRTGKNILYVYGNETPV